VVDNWHLARRKKALHHRAKIIQGIRSFFIRKGFLEVETPYRIPAPAPESHIDPVSSAPWFLQTSPELCMKRMLAAGYEKIFQICRCWREGERGAQHFPEFTLLEWYRSGSDYRQLMGDCELLLEAVAQALGTGETIRFRNREIVLRPPWERISVSEAFERYAGISCADALGQDSFDERMVEDIEPHLGLTRPTLMYDYPSQRASLARRRDDEPALAERFELYIGGLELANGCSELTDPKEQRDRFQIENRNRCARGKPVSPMPERFLSELDAMPPSAGIALGIDRLVMIFLDAATIDDVVAFAPEEL
jgi:elongation factor P--(R)-beta-lysine ligase